MLKKQHADETWFTTASSARSASARCSSVAYSHRFRKRLYVPEQAAQNSLRIVPLSVVDDAAERLRRTAHLCGGSKAVATDL
jgi:hypothetical protein